MTCGGVPGNPGNPPSLRACRHYSLPRAFIAIYNERTKNFSNGQKVSEIFLPRIIIFRRTKFFVTVQYVQNQHR